MSKFEPLRVPDVADGSARRLPRVQLALKIAYTVFCVALVTRYLRSYGPTNFLFFCDQALLLTLVGMWLESSILISMAAVGIIAPQLVWLLDFIATALGHPLVSMTTYMFDASTPLVLRILSGFHGWLPLLLIFLLARLGYDVRAIRVWTMWAATTLLICFFLMPPPRADAGLTPVNINYVWGMSAAAPQTWMPCWAWLAGLVIGLPLFLFLPTHLALLRWMPSAALSPSRQGVDGGSTPDRVTR